MPHRDILFSLYLYKAAVTLFVTPYKGDGAHIGHDGHDGHGGHVGHCGHSPESGEE
jgi:hypothetical protein